MKKEEKWGVFCFRLDYTLTQHHWDYLSDKPHVTWFEKFVGSLSAEGVCIAGLRAIGLEVTV
jgi:hypothetical protein